MNLLLTTHCLIALTVTLVQSSSLEGFRNDVEMERMYRSFLEEENLSDEPGECEVKFKKVGCYKEDGEARALSEEIFNDRKNIDWKAGKWEQFLKRLACRCAKESGEKGYSHFGLQFYGECWSDPQADKRFDRYGKANGCIGFQYKKCDDEDLDNNECVGGGNKNYVYQIVGEGGGSGSGSGFGPAR
ncbi:A disintegrin and metalloproteinase with thrombospondin motif 14 [Desmophyllum pertusum]|uniref:A disintegrin and metalloproteinase with thrombospondin motif 14 n=1 Tax=Desmophyllum pertusum TaxID=174260 RepID=A0A9W9ZPY7_9CNID|nr:A disintegrin and metalloproteinase with thrombospondin motif 14 [Desmophyllum pertusum]